MVQSGPKGRIVQILNPTLFDILYVRVPVIFKLRRVNNLHVAFDATGINVYLVSIWRVIPSTLDISLSYLTRSVLACLSRRHLVHMAFSLLVGSNSTSRDFRTISARDYSANAPRKVAVSQLE